LGHPYGLDNHSKLGGAMETLSDKRLPAWKDEGDDFYRGKDVKEFIKTAIIKGMILEESLEAFKALAGDKLI